MPSWQRNSQGYGQLFVDLLTLDSVRDQEMVTEVCVLETLRHAFNGVNFGSFIPGTEHSPAPGSCIELWIPYLALLHLARSLFTRRNVLQYLLCFVLVGPVFVATPVLVNNIGMT
jgi:hypothetical protein